MSVHEQTDAVRALLVQRRPHDALEKATAALSALAKDDDTSPRTRADRAQDHLGPLPKHHAAQAAPLTLALVHAACAINKPQLAHDAVSTLYSSPENAPYDVLHATVQALALSRRSKQVYDVVCAWLSADPPPVDATAARRLQLALLALRRFEPTNLDEARSLVDTYITSSKPRAAPEDVRRLREALRQLEPPAAAPASASSAAAAAASSEANQSAASVAAAAAADEDESPQDSPSAFSSGLVDSSWVEQTKRALVALRHATQAVLHEAATQAGLLEQWAVWERGGGAFARSHTRELFAAVASCVAASLLLRPILRRLRRSTQLVLAAILAACVHLLSQRRPALGPS